MEADAARRWQAWWRDAGRPEVHAALAQFYATIDADVASRNPACELSGRCCRFDQYGHRLYVTSLEIAWMLRQFGGPAADRLQEATLPANEGCPFQVGKLCSVHALRPLGCRLYFCDPSAAGWLNTVHEQYLGVLRGIHDNHGIAYHYQEWRAGLSEARELLRR